MSDNFLPIFHKNPSSWTPVGSGVHAPQKKTSTSINFHNWLVVWTPLKNISQLGLLFQIYGKIKNVPNHQPDKLFTQTQPPSHPQPIWPSAAWGSAASAADPLPQGPPQPRRGRRRKRRRFASGGARGWRPGRCTWGNPKILYWVVSCYDKLSMDNG